MADLPGYRMTRAAFDVVSVFAAIGARAVPGPVFAAVLWPRGYSPSGIRNQLVRLVNRGLLTRERHGNRAVYRRTATLEYSYGIVAGAAPAPTWTGSFAALLVSIPETQRSDRDRVTYSARFFGYRPLRRGVLIAFADASTRLFSEVPALPAGARDAVEPCKLTPTSLDQARGWVERAFGLPAVNADLADLHARVGAAERAADLTESAYFDLYYDLSRLAMRLPAIPPELLPPGTRAPADQLGALIARTTRIWADRYATPVLARALAVPSAHLIDFDPAQWERLGLPVPAAP